MRLFPDGIRLTTEESKCLSHVTPAEGWVIDALDEKIHARRLGFINKWRPRLLADDSVTELPANEDGFIQTVMARDDYITTLSEIVSSGGKLYDPPSTARYESKVRDSDSDTVLIPGGIEISDIDSKCLLDTLVSIEDWVLGALLGQINRGKKKMISQYHPVIMADPSVTTMPATEDGLINMIVARADYQRLGG